MAASRATSWSRRRPEAGLSAFGELTAKVPFLGGKIGGEFDLICGTGKGKLGANVGPLQFGGDGGDKGGTALGGAVDPSADHWVDALTGATEAKIEGKAGFKYCLPPPPK